MRWIGWLRLIGGELGRWFDGMDGHLPPPTSSITHTQPTFSAIVPAWARRWGPVACSHTPRRPTPREGAACSGWCWWCVMWVWWCRSIAPAIAGRMHTCIHMHICTFDPAGRDALECEREAHCWAAWLLSRSLSRSMRWLVALAGSIPLAPQQGSRHAARVVRPSLRSID